MGETTVLCVACGKPSEEADAAYCWACGWGLGKLQVRVTTPCLVPDDGAGSAWFELECANQGPGCLTYCICQEHESELPLVFNDDPNLPGASPGTLGGLAPKAPLPLVGRVDPKDIAGATQISLTLLSSGCRPVGHGGPARPTLHPEADKCQVAIPVKRVEVFRPRPMADIVVFRRCGDRGFLVVGNDGGRELHYEIGPLPDGFRFVRADPAADKPVEPDLSPDNRTRYMALEPGATGEVHIEAPPLNAPWPDAKLKVDVEKGRLVHTVTLFREPITDMVTGGVSHILGLDFGTDKTAAYATEYRPDAQLREQPEELLHEPSTLYFSRSGGGRPELGRHVDAVDANDVTDGGFIQGMKLLLLEPPGRTVRVYERSYAPAELLRIFLSECLPLAHRKLDTPGRRAWDDTHHVLTIPVVGSDLERDRRAALMAETAQAAGVPTGRVTAHHPEPDCAAIDFVHQRTLGTEGYDFDLRPGDIVCVVDAGAGTTDVSILEWDPRPDDNGGEARFKVRGSIGFKFGGYEIDKLVAWVCYEEWGLGALPTDPDAPKDGPDWFAVKVNATHLQLFRKAKETLYDAIHDGAESPKVGFDPTSFDNVPEGRALHLPYERVSGHLRTRIRQLVLSGDGGQGSIEGCFREAGVSPREVRWVFLTGGTSRVVELRDCIDEFFQRGGSPQCQMIVAPGKDAVINVARGAAMRYQYTIEGALPCALDLLVSVPGSPERTVEMLPARDTPGAERAPAPLHLRMGAEVTYRLVADFGDGRPKGAVYVGRVDLTDNSTEPHRLGFSLRYARQANGRNEATLRVKATLASTGQVVLDEAPCTIAF
ncbi:MAG: hypothetical protein FJX74_03985 [Armatimonadetes bacterium]|nr:hypothetical protein [Armatimonadota bacterium]